MKISLRSLFWLMPLLLLTACGGKIETLTFTSPLGDRSVEVSGKRSSPAGPIVVKVTLRSPAGEESFSFEHQASSLTAENVKATWPNERECDLRFAYDDGTGWELQAFLLDDKLEAIKNYQVDGKALFE